MWGASTDLYFRVDKLLNQLAKPSTHPIRGDELRELPKVRKDQAPQSAFVFVTERGGPFTPESFNHMVKSAGQKAKLPFQVHAHMLRHSTGYKLAGDGHDTRSIQDYLGHKDIRQGGRYTGAVAQTIQGLLARLKPCCRPVAAGDPAADVERSPLT